jgi:hypothetical protein
MRSKNHAKHCKTLQISPTSQNDIPHYPHAEMSYQKRQFPWKSNNEWCGFSVIASVER